MTDSERAKSAIIAYAEAMAETVCELGEVPAGHLYAATMSSLDFHTFDHILHALQDAGLVTIGRNHIVKPTDKLKAKYTKARIDNALGEKEGK